MQTLEICLFEPDAPSQLVAWSKDTLGRGGIVASDVDTAIALLLQRNNSDVRELSQLYLLVIYGAWLGFCVGDLAIAMLGKYRVDKLGIDLKRSFGEREAMDMEPREILSCANRLDILLKYHPDLKNKYQCDFSLGSTVQFTQRSEGTGVN